MPQSDDALANIETRVSTDSIRRTCLLIAVMPSVLLAITYGFFNDANIYGPSANNSALILSLLGWVGVALSYKVTPTVLGTAMIFMVQAVAVHGLIAFGSIRGAGSVLFLATVVGAGIFLGRRAQIAALLTSFAALGAITYAEVIGAIEPKTLQVGILTWCTHAAVLSAVALLVFYARQRIRFAYEQQRQALKENKRLSQERDQVLERFARVFRSNPSAMITQSSATSKILDVNPAFERCYGFTRDEIVGQTDEILWAIPAQRQGFRRELSQNQRMGLINARARRADGTQFDAQLSSEISDASEGNEDGLVISTVADITAQVTTNERLRRSEDRFSKAFNFSPLKLLITRLKDDTVIEVSQSKQSGGQTTAKHQGRPARETGPWFNALDRELFVQRLVESGHLSGYPSSLKRPDGSAIDAKVWAEQIDIDGEPCILSCIVDTTEEQRKDALLRDIAKGMTGHTAQAFFNALTQRMTNALGAEMVFVGEIAPERHINTLSIFKNGLFVENEQLPLIDTGCEGDLTVHSSGLSIDPRYQAWFKGLPVEAAVCQVLYDPNGLAIGIVSAMWTHPINASGEMRSLMAIFASRAHAELMRLRSERETEQLNNTLEQRVVERTAELVKLNLELDSFAYSISHDLKSPLRAIDGFTQLLQERLHDRLDTEERDMMNRVLGATHRMATLMADLLDLARVSQLPLRQERLNLSLMAEDELKHCLEKSPRTQLQSHIELGLVVHADKRLTRVVLKNLLENAIKYTRDQATPLIEIGRVPPPPGSEQMAPEFFVRDNGVGFSMDHADKLFKPFQRLHMPDAGFEGTGIGLATVRRIVERHGGSISGTAQVNLGAEFRFTLGGGKSLAKNEETDPEQPGVAL